MNTWTHAMRVAGITVALALLAACAETQSLPARPAPSAVPSPAAAAPTMPATNAQQPHAYEGDMANSITIQAGDVFTIHNPDFDTDYRFKVGSVTADTITITCDDPSVQITDVGFDDGKGLLLAFSLDGTFTRPIGWARFTPAEHIPVVQFYSIAAGGWIQRTGDE